MTTTLTLSSGYEMPTVGFGTWQASEEKAEEAVRVALNCGYRHIDTTFLYQNEEAIGKSLKKWFENGGEREELFITTKLPCFALRSSDVETYVNSSLERLNLDYIDMYLIHAPLTLDKDENAFQHAADEEGNAIQDDTNHLATWRAMEAQVENGRLRSIGVSNFNESQITNLIENVDMKPSNLQIDLHAYNQQRELRDFCAKNNIVVTAYGSSGTLGTISAVKTNCSLALPSLLEHPVVQSIAEAYEKTPTQVLLRHQIQGGLVVIPKSTSSDRIRQNIDIFDFELTKDEMQQLDDFGEKGCIISYPKFFSGIESHPEYPLKTL